MSFTEIWLLGFALIMVQLTVLWLISVKLKNASIIDVFWGLGFVELAFFYLYQTDFSSPRSTLLTILVAIWGIRLSGYLFFRNYGQPEDPRYQDFRQKYGPKRYWWVSFFQVFLLQGILMSIVALPLLGTMFNSITESLTIIDLVLSIIWLIGFAFEAGGDLQLANFKSDPNNKGKVLNTGFWKYTRHPNYFGDTAIWWSFGLFAISSGSYFVVIGSVIMNLLLLKVSGVTLLEKSLKKSKPAYQEYIERTNAFLPWFPRK